MVVVGVVDSKLQGDSWPMSAHFTCSPFAHTLQRTYRCVPVSEVPRRQHLRSDRCHQLSVLRVRCNSFGTRAFSVAGPTVWNSLPDHLRDPAVDSEQFRRDLKTYPFARTFETLAH